MPRLLPLHLFALGALMACTPDEDRREQPPEQPVELEPLAVRPPEAPRQLGVGYFSPHPDTPDYEASWRERDGETRLRRHGAWVRIDGDRASRVIHVPSGVAIGWTEQSGRILHWSLHASTPSSTADLRSENTGRQSTAIGEACSIWRVYTSLSEPGFRSMSCVTPDGIPVSKSLERLDGSPMGWGDATVTRLERRTVSPAEVVAPDIDVTSWLNGAAPASRPSTDYTVVLRSASGQSLILRRRSGWLGQELRRRGGSALFYAFSPWGDRQVTAVAGAGGRLESLELTTLTARPSDDPNPFTPGEPDQALGHRCIWYNVGAPDAERSECRTDDDMVVRVRTSGWGSFESYEPVSIDRASGPVADVLPPPEWLDRERWGVPDR